MECYLFCNKQYSHIARLSLVWLHETESTTVRALFPSPAQLSVACSMCVRRAWEWGYCASTVIIQGMHAKGLAWILSPLYSLCLLMGSDYADHPYEWFARKILAWILSPLYSLCLVMGSDYADHLYEWLSSFPGVYSQPVSGCKVQGERGKDLHGFPEVHFRSQDLLSASGVFNLISLIFLWVQSSPVQSSD